MKQILILLTPAFLISSISQAQTAEDSVKAVINQLFDGMRNVDAEQLKDVFADSAILQTIKRKADGSFYVQNDAVNKFIKDGRTAQEQEAFKYVAALANFRKTSSAITKGKLMQYVPKDGLYIYFRYDDRQTIMVIANTGDKPIQPDWNFYTERTAGFNQLKDVVTGTTIPLQGFEIKPKESFVFELVK